MIELSKVEKKKKKRKNGLLSTTDMKGRLFDVTTVYMQYHTISQI